MEYLDIVIEDLERRVAKCLADIGVIIGQEIILPKANFPVSHATKDEIDSGRAVDPETLPRNPPLETPNVALTR